MIYPDSLPSYLKISSSFLSFTLIYSFEAELDDNTNAGDFDVDVEVDEVAVEEDPNVKAAQAVSERNAAM